MGEVNDDRVAYRRGFLDAERRYTHLIDTASEFLDAIERDAKKLTAVAESFVPVGDYKPDTKTRWGGYVEALGFALSEIFEGEVDPLNAVYTFAIGAGIARRHPEWAAAFEALHYEGVGDPDRSIAQEWRHVVRALPLTEAEQEDPS